MSWKQRIRGWFGIGQQQQVVKKYQLDPQSVKTNQTILNQQNQIAELQGMVSNYRVKEMAERESEKDYSEEDAIKQELADEGKIIRKKELGSYFSLRTFFKTLDNPKNKGFRESLCFTTFDRKKKISPVIDIGIGAKDIILIGEKNKVILRAQSPQQLFQNPESLGNDVESMKIPINLDEEGGYIDNPLLWDMASARQTDEGEIEYASAKRKPFYKHLQEKDEYNQELLEKLEEREGTIIDMQQKVDDLQLAHKTNSKSAEVARNEKTKMAQKVSEMEKAFNSITSELTTYQQIYSTDEAEIKRLTEIVEKLNEETKNMKSTPEFKQAMETLENVAHMIQKRHIIPKEIKKVEPKEEQTQ